MIIFRYSYLHFSHDNQNQSQVNRLFPRLQVQFDFYYSRLGDSNFIKSPIHIQKMSVCEFFDKFRSKEMIQEILAVSNIPKELTCPLPKVQSPSERQLVTFQPVD